MSPPSINQLDGNNKLYTSESTPKPIHENLNQEYELHNRKQPKQKEIKYFTKEEVLKHDKEDDCWLIVSGSVYDVTRWLPRHPGKRNNRALNM